jgi:hypothetical protein
MGGRANGCFTFCIPAWLGRCGRWLIGLRALLIFPVSQLAAPYLFQRKPFANI